MSTDDRLARLKAQREAIRAHLEWLDEEIKASGENSPTPPIAQPSSPPPTAPKLIEPEVFLSSPPQAFPREEEKIPLPPELSHLEVRPKDIQKQIRRGCLIYIIAFIWLGLLGIFLLYLAFGRTDPMEKRRAPNPSSSLPAALAHVQEAHFKAPEISGEMFLFPRTGKPAPVPQNFPDLPL